MRKKNIFILVAALLSLTMLTGCGNAAAGQKAKSATTVAILGDSYSTFEGRIPEGYACWYYPVTQGNDVSSADQTWWSRLIAMKGYRLLLNSSYSGATICNRGYRGDDYSDRSYITRMKTDFIGEDGKFGRAGASPDILLIFGGTNDDWAGAPMGVPTAKKDLPAADMYQCLPAASYMLSYLTEKLPKTRIIVVVNCDLSETFTKGIQEVAKMYGVESILLHDIDKQRNHPSVKGMSQIAEQISAIL